MANRRRQARWAALLAAAALLSAFLIAAAPAPVAATVPATSPAPIAPETGPAPVTLIPVRTKFTAGEPVDALLKSIAGRFQVMILKPKPIDVTLLTNVELPDSLDASIELAQHILKEQGYGLIKTVTSTGVTLKYGTADEAKQAEQQMAPLTIGTDPSKIDASKPDRAVSHLLPIKRPDLIDSYRRKVTEEKGVDVVILGTAATGYNLLLTGPALPVKHAVQSVTALDSIQDVKTAARQVTLLNMSATEATNRLNEQFARSNPALRAVADTRTNTVIVTGPEDGVAQAIIDLVGMDGYTGVRPRPGALPPPLHTPAPDRTVPGTANPAQGGRGPAPVGTLDGRQA